MTQKTNRPFARRATTSQRLTPRAPVSRFWSALLSIVPAITFGLGAAIPFLYWGFRLRSRRLTAVGATYAGVACGCLVMVNSPNANGSWQAALGGAVAVALACVGTAHAFVVRHEILGRILQLRPVHLDTDPERKALERIDRRAYARGILETDPLLAYELRIGRPDLPRDFDDGGLIDVNHVSAASIARLPDVSDDMASRIVSARESVGGFSSVDDMSVVLGCPPQQLDRLRDFFVCVP